MNSNKSITKIALTFTILATIVWLALLEIDQPLFFSKYDSLGYYNPAYAYNWRALIIQKTIPLINFHQYLGYAHLAMGQTGVLYPPAYIATGLSLLFSHNVTYSIEILAIFHRIIAAAAMFLLLRQLKITPIISVLGALLWSTYPYLTTMATVWALVNHLLVYLPLNFLFLEKLIEKPLLKTALLLAITKTWFFFGGYPEYTFMILVFESLFITIILAKRIDRGQIRSAINLLTPYAISLIVFLLLSTPLWLPMYEAKSFSALRANPVSRGNFNSYPTTLKIFRDAQLFTFHPNTLWWASSSIYHVGIFNLALLALLAIRRIRLKAKPHRVLIYSALALIAYLLSTSLHNYFYGLPLFHYFRRADKYFPFFAFFLTLAIAGIATATAKRTAPLVRQSVHAILLLSVLTNVLVVWNNKETAWSIDNINSPIFITQEFIKPELGRVFSFLDNPPKSNYDFTAFNFASLYNINDFAGQDPLVPKLNYKLALDLNYKAVFKRLPDKKTLKYLSSWSVRYLQTSNTKKNQDYFNQHNQLKPLYQDDKILLYENTKALPYVYDKTKPKQTIPHEFGINEVNIYPTNNNPHQLIVTIAPLPRYIVYFNGKKIGRVMPDNAPLSINVPANTKHILVRYEDPLFHFGVGLFLATWLSIALIFLVNKIKPNLLQKIFPLKRIKLI